MRQRKWSSDPNPDRLRMLPFNNFVIPVRSHFTLVVCSRILNQIFDMLNSKIKDYGMELCYCEVVDRSTAVKLVSLENQRMIINVSFVTQRIPKMPIYHLPLYTNFNIDLQCVPFLYRCKFTIYRSITTDFSSCSCSALLLVLYHKEDFLIALLDTYYWLVSQ